MNKRLPLSVGTILQSRYTIVGQLGHGGMGAVYEAKDNRTSATVALKETYADDDYMRNAFEREAKLLANLAHPALPRSSDFFSDPSRSFFVMELIEGKDLGDQLKERGRPFEPEVVLDWADQILDALEYLHDNSVIHRDIKPANLKCDDRGNIKLLDFGIAKGTVGDITTVQTGSIAAGTRPYAPLEQVLKSHFESFQFLEIHFSNRTADFTSQKTDARSDVYALGATLYHLLTYHQPKPSDLRAFSLWSGKGDTLWFPDDWTDSGFSELATILKRSMEIEPSDRFSNASEMRKRLASKPISHKGEKEIKQEEKASTLDDDFREGRIDLYVYLTTKYPSVSVKTDARNKTNEEQDRLLSKFSEVIRRAELLGFSDLLEDLKNEQFIVSDESILRIDRSIDAEIKISKEIELKEARLRWDKVRKERENQLVLDAAKRERFHEDLREGMILRESQRIGFILKIGAIVLLAIGVVLGILSLVNISTNQSGNVGVPNQLTRNSNR